MNLVRALAMGAAAALVFVCPAQGQETAAADSTRLAEIVLADSQIDSLRLEIRKLDREVQAMKQDYMDDGEFDRLLQALAVETDPDPAAPADTRSRRQRVDSLLSTITQRPGQLRFNGGATMVVQDLVGGETDAAAGTGSLDLYAHTSFGPRTLLFFAFEAGGGEGLNEVLPLVKPLNGDAAPTRGPGEFDYLILNEAWAEFTAFSEAVTLTVGKIDLTNYFDINLVANDETAQFLACAFVNGAALKAPLSSPGIRGRTVLFHRFSIQAGVVSADSTGGTRFRDAFTIGAMGMRLFRDSTYDGNLRAFIYAPAHVGGATGWGLSIDQEVAAILTVFGRYGHNGRGLLTGGGVRQAWSAGLQWERRLLKGQFILAAAFGEAQVEPVGKERIFEAYASWQVNTWTFVSPHIQVARNDATMAQATTAVGLRVQFNF